jgi:hypothetical protein
VVAVNTIARISTAIGADTGLGTAEHHHGGNQRERDADDDVDAARE